MELSKDLGSVFGESAAVTLWGGCGIDFVPLPLARYHYQPSHLYFSYGFKDTLSYAARLNHLIKTT